MKAKDLTVGSELFSQNGSKRILNSIELKQEKEKVFNINLSKDFGFFANDILVGTYNSKVSFRDNFEKEEIVEIDETGNVFKKDG